MNMIVILPWVTLGVGVLWMFSKGNKAKKQYINRREREKETDAARARMLEMALAINAQGRSEQPREFATGTR